MITDNDQVPAADGRMGSPPGAVTAVSTKSPSASPSAVLTAIVCAGFVTAQFVAGKAVRDALFLAHVGIASLPAMVIGTSIFSIALVALTARGVSRLSPARFVSWAFAVSAVLLVLEWALIYRAPNLAAVLVYLHISGLGPILGSGFWLVTTERFDPRTAKKKFGQIAGGGTFGGLLGGLLAERVAVLAGVGAMLPLLGILNLICAWQVRRLMPEPASPPQSEGFSADLTPESAWSGMRVLSETPYLRHLALLILLGTTSAALIDYVFKVQAAATLGTGESLLRFFAVYYAAVSLVTFAVQTSMSQFALERLGLAFTSATPSIALFAGSLGALVAPGLEGAIIARGGESVFRGSLFRAAYEVFYTAVPLAERRAAKSIIDVGFDRVGDAVGGGAIRFILMLAPSLQHVTHHRVYAGLFGRRHCRGQPADPGLYSDARTKPPRPRPRDGSLRSQRDVTTRTIDAADARAVAARRRIPGRWADGQGRGGIRHA